MSIATNLINYLLGYSIKTLSNMERHKAAPYRTGSLIVKTVVSQSINTVIIYYIINQLRPFNLLGNMGLGSRIQGLVGFTGIINIATDIISWHYVKNKAINITSSRK